MSKHNQLIFIRENVKELKKIFQNLLTSVKFLKLYTDTRTNKYNFLSNSLQIFVREITSLYCHFYEY